MGIFNLIGQIVTLFFGSVFGTLWGVMKGAISFEPIINLFQEIAGYFSPIGIILLCGGAALTLVTAVLKIISVLKRCVS